MFHDRRYHHHEHDHDHPHEHGHPHGQVHSDEEKRAVINRISRAIGHLESIRRMVESDADCSEVLIQLLLRLLGATPTSRNMGAPKMMA